MLETYSREQVEAALTSCGWNILQEDGSGLVIYQTNFPPGGDLLIDWSKDICTWDTIKMQLDDFDISYDCILKELGTDCLE